MFLFLYDVNQTFKMWYSFEYKLNLMGKTKENEEKREGGKSITWCDMHPHS